MAAYELSAPQTTTTNPLVLDLNYSYCANEHQYAAITRQNGFRPSAEVHNNNQPFPCRNISSLIKVFNYIHFSLSSGRWKWTWDTLLFEGKTDDKTMPAQGRERRGAGAGYEDWTGFWTPRSTHPRNYSERMKKSGYYSVLRLRKDGFSKKKGRIIVTKSEGVHCVYCAWSFGFRTSHTPRFIISRDLQAFPPFFTHPINQDFLDIADENENHSEILLRPVLWDF